MKKRIVAKIGTDGKKQYILQTRKLGFWFNIREHGHPLVFSSKQEAIAELHVN